MKKICSVCGKEVSKLWRSSPPTCKNCIKYQPIKKISDKHKTTLILYRQVKQDLLKEKLAAGIVGCEINSPDCTFTYEGMHHIAGKENIKKYLDPNNMLMSCNACNLYVETHPEWAYKHNYKIKRNENRR